MSISAWSAAVIAAGFGAMAARAGELMPVAKQNALVHQYCAVCHTDAARNGGISLEHFDAGQASPSLVAMMLSKLTGGTTMQTVKDAPHDRAAAALVERKAKSGAMGAAGIPIPDKATVDALVQAFSVESNGAAKWSVEHAGAAVTASVLREVPATGKPGEAEFYRLIASCDRASRAGYLQLTWSPVPKRGKLKASMDGRAAVTYGVGGSEAMGNGSGLVLDNPASLVLGDAAALPAESLTVRDLFPGETVTFSFAEFPAEARRELGACFAGAER